jgi:hypothetical protein
MKRVSENTIDNNAKSRLGIKKGAGYIVVSCTETHTLVVVLFSSEVIQPVREEGVSDVGKAGDVSGK